ncbi:MAG: AbrB/MazE/SpoVT family DNA-binding domain-containing protein [Nanoarchaeota archaeon]
MVVLKTPRKESIELGTISSRGQIAIPSNIRNEMDLKEGEKVLFLLSGDTLLVKKVTSKTFSHITKPLKEEARRVGFKESEVPKIIAGVRAKKR